MRRVLYIHPQIDGGRANGLSRRILAIAGLLEAANAGFDTLVVPASANKDVDGRHLLLPFMRPYFSAETEQKIITALASGDYSHVIVSSMMLAPYIASVKRGDPGTAIVFDMQDRLSRQVFQVLNSTPGLFRQVARYIAYVLWEGFCSRRSDCVILLSTKDRAAHLQGSKLVYVNNGQSQVSSGSVRASIGPQFSLLFVGDFGYQPNLDGLRFLVEKVSPLLPSGFMIDVVGSSVPRGIADVAGHNVRIHGYVQDLQPLLEAAAVILVPLFQGSGIKNKVVDGMTAGRVVVTTSIGNDGVEAEDGKQILLFSSAQELVTKVADIVSNNESRLRMEALARRHAMEVFSDASAKAAFIEALDRALGNRSR